MTTGVRPEPIPVGWKMKIEKFMTRMDTLGSWIWLVQAEISGSQKYTNLRVAKKNVSVSAKSSNKKLATDWDVVWFRRLRVLLSYCFQLITLIQQGKIWLVNRPARIQVCSNYPHACYKRICPSCNQWDGGWVSSWKLKAIFYESEGDTELWWCAMIF